MRTIKIGIMGLLFNSTNLGCEALAYSFLEIVDRVKNEYEEKINIEICFIENATVKGTVFNCFNYNKLSNKYLSIIKPRMYNGNLEFSVAFYYRFGNRYMFTKQVSNCKYIFDYCMGDSFTDIYGQDRFNEQANLKIGMIKKGFKLVLGSQTIGPFDNKNNEKKAKYILDNAYRIYVRDKQSFTYVKEISEGMPILTTDIAFFLPYEKSKYTEDKINIGINVSGLLWNNGYTGNNEFNLSVDYKTYIRNIIKHLEQNKNTNIYIVPHVLNSSNDIIDNDYHISNKLKEEFPNISIAPEFENPSEAKTFISGLDLFIGARMHADIAAFSSGVPVIPFSYSRKFEGLFSSLNYKFVISGKELNTQEAVKTTIKWIEDKETLKSNIYDAKKYLDNIMNEMIEDIKSFI